MSWLSDGVRDEVPLCDHCGQHEATGAWRCQKRGEETIDPSLCDECELIYRNDDWHLTPQADILAAAEDAHWERLISEEREA